MSQKIFSFEIDCLYVYHVSLSLKQRLIQKEFVYFSFLIKIHILFLKD